jgi:hypothetical protein
VRLRGFGAYAYRIADPRVFFANVPGTRDVYAVADLEGQLRSSDHLDLDGSPRRESGALPGHGGQSGRAGARGDAERRARRSRSWGSRSRRSRFRTCRCPRSSRSASTSASGWASSATCLGTRSSRWRSPSRPRRRRPAARPAPASGWAAGIAMGQAMSQVIGSRPIPLARAPRPASLPPGPAPSAPAPGTVCARCETPVGSPRKFCPECGAPLA